MSKLSLNSKLYIAAVSAIGAGVLVNGLLHWRSASAGAFLVLLLITLSVSRMRVKLPGMNGVMSVNLPFLLISAARLGTGEALLIAALAGLVQSLPRGGKRVTAVQVVFNSATIVNAVAATACVFRVFSHNGIILPLSMAAAGAAFFIVNTVPVVLVLWLAEAQAPFKTWRAMATLSGPFYVLSAGVAAIVCPARHLVFWGLGLGLIPLMYSIYISYRTYFAVQPTADSSAFQAPASAALLNDSRFASSASVH
jgi:MASE9 protein